MWPFRKKAKMGDEVAKKGASCSGKVPIRISSGKDPMNDTQFIAASLSDNLDELSRLKSEVKKKHDTSIMRAARWRHDHIPK